jgi:hypothetical protein
MKFKINIECSPQEARDFFGLPNVAKLNETIMVTVQDQMTSQIANMDPETLIKSWMPAGVNVFEKMQEQFYNQFSGGSEKKED